MAVSGAPGAGGTGGGESGRGGRPGVWRHLPALVVLGGLIGSALIMIPDQLSYRAACAGVSATCAAAATMRLLLPTSWVGVLAVRSRALDTIVLVTMAVVVWVLAFSVPLPAS